MNDEQRERYSRHILLPEMGEEGQRKLLDSKVLIVGAGGLGSPVALYLAASGVGTIGLADGDTVSLSNLQRQIAHFTDDLGRMKVSSACDKLKRMNPDVQVDLHPHFIDDDNVNAIVSNYDFIVEATDNASSRYRINDACVSLGKPFCIGGVSCYSGQLMTHVPGSIDYRSLFPESPDEPQTPAAVLSPVVGILGTLMATEAIKCLAGIGTPLTNRLLTFDALTMDFNVYELNK